MNKAIMNVSVGLNFFKPLAKSYPVLCALICLFLNVTAVNNGVLRTPPMGWNDFNQWGGGLGAENPDVYKYVADSLISTGLRDIGYIYVNKDGAYPYPGRSPATHDSVQIKGFVEFSQSLSGYMHERDLKWGVYMTTTIDPDTTAKMLVAGGVDYLKHDDWGGKPLDFWKSVSVAVLGTNRPIAYMTNSCKDSTVCHVFRTGGDIKPIWSEIMSNFDANYMYLQESHQGYWADADMMQVGCRNFTEEIYLSYDESRAHFSLWCFMASPLIIGFDLSNKHPINKAATMEEYRQTVSIFANAELVALDQDTIGLAGHRIKGQGALEVWLKNCADGAQAVMMFNRTSSSADMKISQQELGWETADQIYIRDLWLHENLDPFSGEFTKNVASHAAEIFKVSTSPIDISSAVMRSMDRSVAWLEKGGHSVFPVRLIPRIISENAPEAQLFDIRGRTIAQLQTSRGSAGTYLLRIETPEANAQKFVWPCGSRHKISE